MQESPKTVEPDHEQPEQKQNDENCAAEPSPAPEPDVIDMPKIRYEKAVPPQFSNGLTPYNVEEQKERFLRRNITPEFKHYATAAQVEHALSKEVFWYSYDFNV